MTNIHLLLPATPVRKYVLKQFLNDVRGYTPSPDRRHPLSLVFSPLQSRTHLYMSVLPLPLSTLEHSARKLELYHFSRKAWLDTVHKALH